MDLQQSLLVYYRQSLVITYPLKKAVTVLGSDYQLSDFLLPFPQVPPLALVLCRQSSGRYIYALYDDQGQIWASHFLDSQQELTVVDQVQVVLVSHENSGHTLVCLPDVTAAVSGTLECYGQSYQLDDIMMVGQGANNDLVVADEYLSQNHFIIQKRENRYFIRDLSSTNGTMVDGYLVLEAELPASCTITAGKSRFNFRMGTGGEQTAVFWHGMVGKSPAMRELQQQIMKTTTNKLHVLIHGETGCGKELVARAVYEVNYPDGQAPYVVRNCAALSENLLSSELFGHRRGAFTGATESRRGAFALADQGVLFLDEMGEMPLGMQPKLLRAVEYGEITPLGSNKVEQVQVRVVTATHRNLVEMVREERFRQDLYYRLSAFPLIVPPLRQRGSDILLLARYFLDHYGAADKVLSLSAQRWLLNYSWPGNVREFSNCIQMTLCSCHSRTIEDRDFALVCDNYKKLDGRNQIADLITQGELKAVLARHHNKRSAAARELHISRSTLYRLLLLHGLADKELM